MTRTSAIEEMIRCLRQFVADEDELPEDRLNRETLREDAENALWWWDNQEDEDEDH